MTECRSRSNPRNEQGEWLEYPRRPTQRPLQGRKPNDEVSARIRIKTIRPAISGQPLSTSFSIYNFYLPVAYWKQYRTFSAFPEMVKPKPKLNLRSASLQPKWKRSCAR